MRFAESPVLLTRGVKSIERGFPLEESLKDVASSKRIYPFSSWQKRLPSITDAEFAADKVDYGEMPETLSRTAAVPPPDSLDDPFVADDTFQDQGPGSVEIYKLDLSKEKTLLTASTPSANLSLKNKGKVPKKTGRLDSTKTKATDVKPTMTMTTTTDSKHRQSNFFDEQRTEMPTINRDIFGIGGVPELQVGCEGLEASSSSRKTKRSIDAFDKKKEEASMSVLLDVTPVSLDFDYDLSYDETEFEEMDELIKLKRLETSTKSNRPNRGDIDASHLNFDHLDDPRRPEKLPVRGDLGKSIVANSNGADQGESIQQPMNSEMKNRERIKAKGRPVSGNDDDDAKSRGRGRRLLWHAAANTEGFAGSESERKHAKRSIDWGFGENEGVVSSDELQTVNERRRQHEMRYHQNATRLEDRETNLKIDDIRRQYEQLLEQKRREEEERLRRIQQDGNRRVLNRWEEEEKRRNEMRRRQYEEYRRRMDHTSTPRADDEETKERWRHAEAMRNRTQDIAGRNEEKRRRQEEEERRRRLQEEQRKSPQNVAQGWQMNMSGTNSRTLPMNDEERRRRLYNEEMWRRKEETRRQDQYRWQEEARRKEAEKRLEDPARHLSEDDRRRFEERRRQWAEKRRQEEEDERRRQQAPSNLMHRVSPNDIGQRDRGEEKRMQEERRRDQKLREYIARNRPINVSRADQRSEEDERRRTNVSGNDEQYRRRMEEQRRRQDEERKLQEYIRRNQPVNLPKASAAGRDLFEERRQIEEARRRGKYPDPGARRHHGPSASTYIDPLEEVRRRQQETARRLEQERRQEYEAEERRKELARRQREEEEKRRLQEERMRKEALRREEEARRAQSRSYEENRKRLAAARLQAEERRREMLRERSRSDAERTRRPEATRPIYYQDPRLLVEHRRRQESRPIPSNLTRINQAEARRAAAERGRLQAERRWEEENRYVREWRKNVSWSTEQESLQESSFVWQTLFVPRYQRSAIVHLSICLSFILFSFYGNKRYFVGFIYCNTIARWLSQCVNHYEFT